MGVLRGKKKKKLRKGRDCLCGYRFPVGHSRICLTLASFFFIPNSPSQLPATRLLGLVQLYFCNPVRRPHPERKGGYFKVLSIRQIMKRDRERRKRSIYG